MQFSLKFALRFFVAVAICVAQTKSCWPGPGQTMPMLPLCATFVYCAAWIAFATARPRIRPKLQRRIGIALVAVSSLGCLLAFFAFAMSGIRLMASAPPSAAVVAHGRAIAMLFAAPCGLLFVTALSAVWSARVTGNDRKTIMAVIATVVGTPLITVIGFAIFGSPIFGLIFAALALGAFVMEGGLGDKHEKPAAGPTLPPGNPSP